MCLEGYAETWPEEENKSSITFDRNENKLPKQSKCLSDDEFSAALATEVVDLELFVQSGVGQYDNLKQ